MIIFYWNSKNCNKILLWRKPDSLLFKRKNRIHNKKGQSFCEKSVESSHTQTFDECGRFVAIDSFNMDL